MWGLGALCAGGGGGGGACLWMCGCVWVGVVIDETSGGWVSGWKSNESGTITARDIGYIEADK